MDSPLSIQASEEEVTALVSTARPKVASKVVVPRRDPLIFNAGMSCPVSGCDQRPFQERRAFDRHWRAVHVDKLRFLRCLACTETPSQASVGKGGAEFRRPEDLVRHLRKKHRYDGETGCTQLPAVLYAAVWRNNREFISSALSYIPRNVEESRSFRGTPLAEVTAEGIARAKATLGEGPLFPGEVPTWGEADLEGDLFPACKTPRLEGHQTPHPTPKQTPHQTPKQTPHQTPSQTPHQTPKGTPQGMLVPALSPFVATAEAQGVADVPATAVSLPEPAFPTSRGPSQEDIAALMRPQPSEQSLVMLRGGLCYPPTNRDLRARPHTFPDLLWSLSWLEADHLRAGAALTALHEQMATCQARWRDSRALEKTEAETQRGRVELLQRQLESQQADADRRLQLALQEHQAQLAAQELQRQQEVARLQGELLATTEELTIAREQYEEIEKELRGEY